MNAPTHLVRVTLAMTKIVAVSDKELADLKDKGIVPTAVNTNAPVATGEWKYNGLEFLYKGVLI